MRGSNSYSRRTTALHERGTPPHPLCPGIVAMRRSMAWKITAMHDDEYPPPAPPLFILFRYVECIPLLSLPPPPFTLVLFFSLRAGLLLTNVLICIAMVRRIKRVEATLPVEYLQRVGYLQVPCETTPCDATKMCCFLFCACFVFFILRRTGKKKASLHISTYVHPRMFIHVVCRFNLIAFAI